MADNQGNQTGGPQGGAAQGQQELLTNFVVWFENSKKNQDVSAEDYGQRVVNQFPEFFNFPDPVAAINEALRFRSVYLSSFKPIEDLFAQQGIQEQFPLFSKSMGLQAPVTKQQVDAATQQNRQWWQSPAFADQRGLLQDNYRQVQQNIDRHVADLNSNEAQQPRQPEQQNQDLSGGPLGGATPGFAGMNPFGNSPQQIGNASSPQRLVSIIKPSTPEMAKALAAYEGYMEMVDPQELQRIKNGAISGNFDESAKMALSVSIGNNYFSKLEQDLRQTIYQRYNVDIGQNFDMGEVASQPQWAGDAEVQRIMDQAIAFSTDFKTHLDNDFPYLKNMEAIRLAKQANVDAWSAENPVASTLLFGVLDPLARKGEMIIKAAALPFRLASASESLLRTGVGFMTGTDIPESVQSRVFRDMSDGYVGWVDSMTDDWSPLPSHMQGNLIEDGRMNVNRLLPTVVDGVWTLMAFGGAGMAAGKAGTMTMSFMLTYEDSYQRAKELGLTEQEADKFAFVHSAIQASIELVSPNINIAKAWTGQAFNNVFRNVLSSGATRRVAFNSALRTWGTELLKENGQEITQLLAEKATEWVWDNAIIGAPTFKPTLTRDALMETVIATTLTTGIAGSRVFFGDGGMSAATRDGYYQAAQDMDAFNATLDRMQERGTLTAERRAEVSRTATLYANALESVNKEIEASGKQMSDERKATLVHVEAQLLDLATRPTATEEQRKRAAARLYAIRTGVAEEGKRYSGEDVALVMAERQVDEGRRTAIASQDYEGRKISLQEMYEQDEEFRQMVDAARESRGTDEGVELEQPVPSIPLIDIDGTTVLEGKEELAKAYANGETEAVVYAGVESLSSKARQAIADVRKQSAGLPDAKYLNDVVKRLKRALGDVEVSVSQEEFDAFIKENGKNPDEYRGVRDWATNRILINPKYFTKDTPIHEFGHIWVDILKNSNAALYEQALEMVSKTQYYDETASGYSDLNDRDRMEEALVQAIGEKGAALMTQRENAGAWSQFWQEFMDLIRRTFNLDSGFNFESATLDDFTTQMAKRALFTGKASGNQGRKNQGEGFDAAPTEFDFEAARGTTVTIARQMAANGIHRITDQIRGEILGAKSYEEAAAIISKYKNALDSHLHALAQLGNGTLASELEGYDGSVPYGMTSTSADGGVTTLNYRGATYEVTSQDGSFQMTHAGATVGNYASLEEAMFAAATAYDAQEAFLNPFDAQFVSRRFGDTVFEKNFQRYDEMVAAGEDTRTIYEETGVFLDPVNNVPVYNLPSRHATIMYDKALPNRTYRFEEVIDYPGFTEVYPEARDIRVEFKELSFGELGSYSPNENKISLPVFDWATMEQSEIISRASTLIHELQHFIQDKEGWQKGTNTLVSRMAIMAQYESEWAATPEAKPLLEAIMETDKVYWEYWESQFTSDNFDQVRADKLWDDFKDAMVAADNAVLSYLKEKTGEIPYEVFYNKYRAAGGEVQSRMAEEQYGYAKRLEEEITIEAIANYDGDTDKADVYKMRADLIRDFLGRVPALPQDYDPRLAWNPNPKAIRTMSGDLAKEYLDLYHNAARKAANFNAQKNHPDSFVYTEGEQEAINLSKAEMAKLQARYPEAVELSLATDKHGRYKFETDKQGNLKYKKPGKDGVAKPYLIPYAQVPYGIKQGLEEHHGVKTDRNYNNIDEVAQKLADLIIPEAEQALLSPEALAGIGWYSAFKETLYQTFGGNARMVAQVLGTTSPQTPVPNNYGYTMEFGNRLSRGEYDALIEEYRKHLEEVNGIFSDEWYREYVLKNDATLKAQQKKGQPVTEQDIEDAIARMGRIPKEHVSATRDFAKTKGVVRRENGKMFGLAANAPLEVIHNQWLNFVDGPKTPNFAKNLVGESRNATIDLWAARFIRRVIYDGKAKQWRILPATEMPVQHGYRAGDGMLTNDYGIAERAMGLAAESLGMHADDLQALLWFHEKVYWEQNGWSDLRFGDFREEIARHNNERFVAGITTTRGTAETVARDLTRLDNASPGVLDDIAKAAGLPADAEIIGKAYEEAIKEPSLRATSATVAAVEKHLGATIEDHMNTVRRAEMNAIKDEIAKIEVANGNIYVKVLKDGEVKQEKFNTLVKGTSTARTNDTLGYFEGAAEGSMDVEFTVMGNPDMNNVWARILDIAERYNQDSAFLTTTVAEGHPNARPMLGVYFGGQLTDAEIEQLTNIAKDNYVDFTMTTDTEGRISGFTTQYMPEYEGPASQEAFDADVEAFKAKASTVVAQIKEGNLGEKLNFGDITTVSTVLIKNGQYGQAQQTDFRAESNRPWTERVAAFNAQRVRGNQSESSNQTGGVGTVQADSHAVRRTDRGGTANADSRGDDVRELAGAQGGNVSEDEGKARSAVDFATSNNSITSFISQAVAVGMDHKTMVAGLRQTFGLDLFEANELIDAYRKGVNQRQRGFQSNSIRRNAGDGTAKGFVADVADRNRSYYERMNLQETYDEVKAEMASRGGYDEALVFAELLDNKGDAARLQMARMQALEYYANQAQALMDSGSSQQKIDEYVDKIEKVEAALSKAATAAGQAIVALRLWSSASGATTIRRVERLIKAHNEKVNKTSTFLGGLWNRLAGKRIVPPLTSEQQTAIKQKLAKIHELEAGSQLQMDLARDLAEYIGKIVPMHTGLDTFIALQYASLLSGYSTHALNILSAGFNIATKPFRDVLNPQRWTRAVAQGVKERSLQTFADLIPLAGFVMGIQSTARGMRAGSIAFFDTLLRGGDASKYVENHHTTGGVIRGARVSPLERNNGRAFRGKYNPANLAKYVGRLLAATDKLTFYTGYEREMAGAARQAMFDAGLRGKALRQAAASLYMMGKVDMDGVTAEVDRRVAVYESSAGKKATKAQVLQTQREVLAHHYGEQMQRMFNDGNLINPIEVRRDWRRQNAEGLKLGIINEADFDHDEHLQDMIDRGIAAMSDEREAAERLAQGNIFTDDRHGVVARIAGGLSRVINSHAGVTLALKPFIPFTKIVGNVTEYMLDATPVYGLMRANGLGISGIIERFGGFKSGSSRLGVKRIGKGGKWEYAHSREYFEQSGRAWIGTIAFAALAYLALPGDDDDDEERLVEISGGAFQYTDPQRRSMVDNSEMPRYTLRIGNFKMNYMNLPGLAVPMAILGSYSDTFKNADMADEERELRLWHATMNGFKSITDLSFLTGVRDLLGFAQLLFDATDESGQTRITKQIAKTYGGFALRPLPQNFNIVRQTIKFFDPSSYSQKDLQSIMNYNMGIHYWTNRPNIDIFGEEVKTYPGETLMPYTHWADLKGTDPDWQFLAEFGAIPSAIRNTSEMRVGYVYRTLEDDELYEYQKLAGQNFRQNLRKYKPELERIASRGVVRDRPGRNKTEVQLAVQRIWEASKKSARYTLMKNGTIDVNLED